MIRATRREALAGALALPAVASLAKAPKRKASGSVLLHDPSLEVGRAFVAAGQARGDKVLPIEGDRIRFARAVFERVPALVIGVSRSADAVLIEDVAREAGYAPVAVPAPLAAMLAGTQGPDRGQALGWALAPCA
jgi:hypothetical protein